MWSERGERIATGAERPRNDTVTRSVWSGRTESSAPTEGYKELGGAGDREGRPYGWEHAGMSLGTNGGMDMKKCGYCGKEVKDELDFCSDGCEKSYKDENEKDERRIKYFAGGIVLGLLVIAVSAFTKSVFMVGIGVIIMGIVEFLLPFTTPETIAFLGYKRAKTAGRIAGIALIAVGIWVGLI